VLFDNSKLIYFVSDVKTKLAFYFFKPVLGMLKHINVFGHL